MLSRNSSVGLASALGTPKAVRLGPIPRTTILLSPLFPPRIKPAITILLPVPTKALVLMLASFPEPRGLDHNFHQANARGVVLAPDDRSVGAGI